MTKRIKKLRNENKKLNKYLLNFLLHNSYGYFLEGNVSECM